MNVLGSTHDAKRRGWAASAQLPDGDFAIQNLPLGIFSREGGSAARSRRHAMRLEQLTQLPTAAGAADLLELRWAHHQLEAPCTPRRVDAVWGTMRRDEGAEQDVAFEHDAHHHGSGPRAAAGGVRRDAAAEGGQKTLVHQSREVTLRRSDPRRSGSALRAGHPELSHAVQRGGGDRCLHPLCFDAPRPQGASESALPS
jgi:hypothetical protein